jgi:hypothetical protein
MMKLMCHSRTEASKLCINHKQNDTIQNGVCLPTNTVPSILQGYLSSLYPLASFLVKHKNSIPLQGASCLLAYIYIPRYLLKCHPYWEHLIGLSRLQRMVRAACSRPYAGWCTGMIARDNDYKTSWTADCVFYDMNSASVRISWTGKTTPPVSSGW